MRRAKEWDEVYIGELFTEIRESIINWEITPRCVRQGSYIAIFYWYGWTEKKRMVSQKVYKILFALMEGELPHINNIPQEER